MPIFTQQHIGRFDITMNNTMVVSTIQPFGSLNNKVGCFSYRQGLFQTILQRPTIDIFHHNKSNIALGAKIVNLDNIWMSQSGNRARLLLETLHENRIASMISRQDLNSHITVKRRLISFENRSHTTRPNGLNDAELAQ